MEKTAIDCSNMQKSYPKVPQQNLITILSLHSDCAN